MQLLRHAADKNIEEYNYNDDDTQHPTPEHQSTGAQLNIVYGTIKQAPADK